MEDGGTGSRARAFLLVTVVYVAALAAALVAGRGVSGRHPITVAAAADVVATLVVFAASRTFSNSSLYDPYWSVAPPAIAAYFALAAPTEMAVALRQVVVLALVFAWAVRLTHNWARGWTGLAHEDWRYVDMKRRSGRLYWPVSFLGIHLFPTVMVLLGCLPLWPALATGTRPFGAIDLVAALVTLAGIALELAADAQLRRFRLSGPPAGAILDTGLWAWSRHPNYFGEILFWWGLALFGLAAAGPIWWIPLGAVAITAMFLLASLPLIETRMAERRGERWAAYCERVPRLVPRPPRSRS
ncbi:MAG TPA: DUF1295 domain-containing protein [Myxococcota bacterium]|nr:DUF1295 domain-containing protein [Myxococcota bacterium]